MSHASIRAILDRHDTFSKTPIHQEQTVKLDVMLGFDGTDASGRKMVEMGNKKRVSKIANPLSSLVAGTGFEPVTFGL
jgi:hypothetical protein